MELLRRDVHPAEVSTPDGSVFKRCRAFVTSERLIVWQEADRKVKVALDVALTEPSAVPPNRGSLFGSLECETEHGTYWVNAGRGCGCGQMVLKALGPPAPWTQREVAA
jgi:hypothetical protein